MNMKIVVLGAVKAGKTLFCINFAEFLGATSLFYLELSSGGASRGILSPDEARRLMVEHGSRSNGAVRSFAVHLSAMGLCRVLLVDTSSLKEKNPLPRAERKGLTLTLQALRQADTVVYLVDLSCSDPSRLDFASRAERSLATYCHQNGKNYLCIGSKKDLCRDNRINEYFFSFNGNGRMPRVSALNGDGFEQLRRRLITERRFIEV